MYNVLPMIGTFEKLTPEEMQKLVTPKIYLSEEEKNRKQEEYRQQKEKEFEEEIKKEEIDSSTILINPIFANTVLAKKRKLYSTEKNVWGQKYNV